MSKTREVILGDWLDNDIEDKSIDVLMCDPPYYNVKGDFDFIWDSFEEYLKDVEKWAVECKRILKDNGSLFWWGHAKKIAYAQIIFDKYFNLGNSLVWEKKECQTKAQDYGQARYFAPITERCLFYSNEIEMSGREFIEKEYIAPRNP
jgi:site-specific DNA-methyltransferase (adenine-specific)